MLNKKLFLSIVACVVLVNECSAVVKKELSESEIKKIAKDAIMTVGGKLKSTLIQKVKQGGVSNAADFCSKEAGVLAKEASKVLPKGVSIKRITNKPRNKMNQATPEQLKVLEEIDLKLKAGNMPPMVIKKISNGHYQVYKPLKIAKQCLNCHGDNNTRNKQAYSIIKDKYTNDKAIGYKVGELRGAFLVDIKR